VRGRARRLRSGHPRLQRAWRAAVDLDVSRAMSQIAFWMYLAFIAICVTAIVLGRYA
jgi:hypothetical protein